MNTDESEVWQNFENDAADSLRDIEESLLALESDASTTENLHRLYRGLHSIKGNCGFLGLTTVERLAHVSEDLIGSVRDGGVELDDEIVELMLRAIDRLRAMIEVAARERADAPASAATADLVENIVEAFALRGGSRETTQGGEWGLFSLAPAAEPAPDAEPIGMFLAITKATLPMLGEAMTMTRTGTAGALPALREACSSLAGPAERLGLVHVVDALERLVSATDSGTPVVGVDSLELDLYSALVEVEDYHSLLAPADAGFELRTLFDSACAEIVVGDLAWLAQLLESPSGLRHQSLRSLMRRLRAACGHHAWPVTAEHCLDLEDALARCVEGGRDFDATLVERAQRFAAELARRVQEALDGAEASDLATAPVASVVSIEGLALSAPLARVLTLRTVALVEEARAKGWSVVELRASAQGSQALDSELRDWLAAGSVTCVTSAVDAADYLFLIATPSLPTLHAELDRLRVSGLQLRLPAAEPAPVRPLQERSPTKVEPPKPASKPANSTAGEEAEAKVEFLRVDARKVSLIMDLASEIGLACGAVTHHPDLEGLELEGFAAAAHKLELLVREMQNEVSGMRLVPVAGVFQRMKRVVRDTARRTGKQVELVLEGEETEIDKLMVDALQDPLVHVLRSAIDHGIEASEERLRLGKPAAGRIVLSASHQGGEVSIEVSDDGSGVHRERVLERARSRGLIDRDATLTDHQVVELVFLPGFSTKEAIDELSGRGVGMDVLRTTIESLRGRVGIRSTEGRGSRVTMTMPLTLAFVEAMVVRERDRLFALPIEKVFEVFKVAPTQISRNSADGQTLVRVRDILVPVLWLHRFWNEACADDENLDGHVVVVVQTSRGEFALPVDALLGNQQVMLKPLRGPLAGIRAAAGCGMLRSGDVAVAIDCDQLHA